MGDPTFLILIVLLAGAMFFMSSRTRKQQRAAQTFRASLEPGKEIMTASGMIGRVVSVDAETEIVTIESESGTRTEWVLGAVNERPARYATPAEDDDAEADDEDGSTADDGSVTEKPGTASNIAPDVIDVPDDLSGLDDAPRDPKARRDGDTDGK
ncbi:preprotein translocase subunit YajC [Antribacter gilvus]|uniref:preprotein translocase subunit YajC n=1 Tax=Antribacter gilvus TaxID=2304675 RepID=UPI001F0C9563|nr:preprotein translocase subunit YajC [Antribacter gilvus]